MTIKALSESSPVTIGLTAAMIAIAFYLGDAMGAHRAELQTVKDGQVLHSAAIAGLANTVNGHEVRIAGAERLLEQRHQNRQASLAPREHSIVVKELKL
ncbi:MAG: hypothetical protein H0T51_07725 [Pirellulales bacterium]|nr:hypothetical protein [Pirellulales bacterium]